MRPLSPQTNFHRPGRTSWRSRGCSCRARSGCPSASTWSFMGCPTRPSCDELPAQPASAHPSPPAGTCPLPLWAALPGGPMMVPPARLCPPPRGTCPPPGVFPAKALHPVLQGPPGRGGERLWGCGRGRGMNASGPTVQLPGTPGPRCSSHSQPCAVVAGGPPDQAGGPGPQPLVPWLLGEKRHSVSCCSKWLCLPLNCRSVIWAVGTSTSHPLGTKGTHGLAPELSLRGGGSHLSTGDRELRASRVPARDPAHSVPWGFAKEAGRSRMTPTRLQRHPAGCS